VTHESVHKAIRKLWDEIKLIEEQESDLKIRAKSLKLQREAKLAKVRKLGSLDKGQMAQLELMDFDKDVARMEEQ